MPEGCCLIHDLPNAAATLQLQIADSCHGDESKGHGSYRRGAHDVGALRLSRLPVTV